MHIIGIDSREHPTEVTIGIKCIKCIDNHCVRLTTLIRDIRNNIRLSPSGTVVSIIHDQPGVNTTYQMVDISAQEYEQIDHFLTDPMRQILLESIPVGVPKETRAYVETMPTRRIATNAIMELEV